MENIPKEFWDDQQWGFRHHSSLLRDFKDKWVAISDRKVVSSGTSLEFVMKEAKRITKKNQVPVMFVECGAHIY